MCGECVFEDVMFGVGWNGESGEDVFLWEFGFYWRKSGCRVGFCVCVVWCCEYGGVYVRCGFIGGNYLVVKLWLMIELVGMFLIFMVGLWLGDLSELSVLRKRCCEFVNVKVGLVFVLMWML